MGSLPVIPQPVSGNPMTQFLQSSENNLTNIGGGAFSGGQSTYQAGLNDFGPSQQYWNDILSGNKVSMESAIAPEKSDILSQYRARRKQLAQQGGRGGGTNEAVASSEFAQAGDVAGLLQKLRPQAAKESGGIAAQIANLGLGESGLGAQELNTAIQSALSQSQQDVEKRGQNMAFFSNLVSALI